MALDANNPTVFPHGIKAVVVGENDTPSTIVQQAAVTALTNNSGGSVSNTIAVVPAATAASTDTSAASLASTNAAITAVKNDIASLTAKLNEINSALQAAGVTA